MKYRVVTDADGNVVQAGYSMSVIADIGQTLTEYTEPDAALQAKVRDDVAELKAAPVAAYDDKVDAESLSLSELIKLLKLKGVI